ncbi:major facilitator superfamily domain-containing protein [Hypoxylon sp. FL1150]|nr:major facilitator superfamily domain-containing protein [Hypoxylon sp. FL1150]
MQSQEPANNPPSYDEATKVILTEVDCPEALATSWSNTKKWTVLAVIFIIQMSMNLNASLYASAQRGIMEKFGVGQQAAATGAAIFLVFYAFGCELWAPWSEEFGRRIVLQASLVLVNVCCVSVGIAEAIGWFPLIIIGRALGGQFSAGGSVTLGMVADMFETNDQEHPLAFIVLSSVGGSIVGPIIGGFIQTNCHWTWAIWAQVIFGFFAQILHLQLVPETRASALVAEHARKLRESGERPNVYGYDEIKTMKEKLVPSNLFSLWGRPFKMLLTERIVLCLSLLSGFSDALIFMQIQSFDRVFKVWNFTEIEVGLAFIPIGIAYMVGYLLYLPVIHRNKALRRDWPHDDKAHFESRLWMLLWTVPLLPLGMLLFAWTTFPEVPWIVPMIGWLFIGIANYCIYVTTIDYMVAAYGSYSASATGSNGFARDLLAGVLTWAANPYYDAFTMDFGFQIANTILAGIAFVLVICVYFIYVYGPSMRKKSPFAQSLTHSSDRTSSTAPSLIVAS